MARKRSSAVTIISSIGIVWGVLALLARLLLKGNLELITSVGSQLGMPGPFLAVSALFIPILWILSSIGLLLGAKWGWWLASWHYMCGIFRFGQAYLIATGYRVLPVEGSKAVFAFRNVAFIFIYGCLLLFAYSTGTRTWCRVETIPLARAALLSGVVLLTLLGSVSLAVHFLFKGAG